MRVLGLALTGVLALLTAMPVHADPARSKFRAGSGPGSIQPSTGLASHPAPDQVGRRNTAWLPTNWGPNRSNSLRGPHRGWAGPYTVWGAPYVPYVWGGPYVPYPGYGDWGALWYPYAEWRGPTGGWGNP